ncbi:TRAP transporter substrate-binding protein DctP [Marinobacter sp. 1_MG-2023]|nr:TRAP transporter substrate-binding protein DctP [Marinobacter sp. 1_MG-2023]MDO6822760.1 TRAP transporter substrate-binding protein DctP [Marinobacter sp. 1_MG-2023]
MPESAFTTTYGAKAFMKKVDELSDGRISFQYFPAEQLGKGSEALTLLQSGVADIANVAPAYLSEHLPLSAVVELPGMVTDSCTAAEKFNDLVQPGESLYEAEYKRKNIRPLFTANLGPYRILTNGQNLSTPLDISGLKLRTAGGAMAMTADRLGANPIRMQGSDVLPSLSRGTLDGVFWGLISVEDWSLETALDQMVPNLSVGSFNVTYSISDRTWEKLSPENKEILTKAGQYANQNHCDYVNRAEKEAISVLEEKHGISPLYLPEAELKNIQEKLTQVHKDWAEPLEKRGLPANAVVEQML